MAARRASGGESQRRHGDDVRAVERDEPVRGPHELLGVPVRAGARVAHHLRDRKLRDRVVERGLEALRQRLALGETREVHVVRLAVRGDVDAVRPVGGVERRGREMRPPEPCELLPERFGRPTIGAACDLGRHQLVGHLMVGRDRQDVRHRHGEPPRRRIGRHGRPIGEEPAIAQAARERLRERVAEASERLGGQLLGEELDQQRRGAHGVALAYCAGRLARSRSASIG